MLARTALQGSRRHSCICQDSATHRATPDRWTISGRQARCAQTCAGPLWACIGCSTISGSYGPDCHAGAGRCYGSTLFVGPGDPGKAAHLRGAPSCGGDRRRPRRRANLSQGSDAAVGSTESGSLSRLESPSCLSSMGRNSAAKSGKAGYMEQSTSASVFPAFSGLGNLRLLYSASFFA